MRKAPSRRDRIVGGLVGLAVGDALGVPVENEPRAYRDADPVLDMRSGGGWLTGRGLWSDDTSLALCLAESIVLRGFDPEDAGRRSLAWLDEGRWTAQGAAFGIGGSTYRALTHIRSGMPAVMAGGRGENDNGNGSLMRILPASIWLSKLPEPARFRAVASYSAYTHGHPRSLLGCWLHCLVASRLLEGYEPAAAVEVAAAEARRLLPTLPGRVAAQAASYSRILDRPLTELTRDDVRGSGYVVHCLEAALYCLVTTSDYSSCALAAVNLGEDADTTAAVAGGLAGLAYGVGAIPHTWRTSIARADEISNLAERLSRLVDISAPLPRSYWVLPGKLLAGGYPDVEGGDLDALLDAGIDAFVDLTVEGERSIAYSYEDRLRRAASVRRRAVEYERISIADMSAELERVELALREIDRFLHSGHSVYVHCLGGLGRTGTVVGSFLVKKGLARTSEALKLIAALRSSTDTPASPSPQTDSQRSLIESIRPDPDAFLI